MIIRAFTIFSLTLLAIGFMGACYSGVEEPSLNASQPVLTAPALTSG